MSSARQRTFLAEWRAFRAMTQEKAAGLIGVSPGHLSHLEAGRKQYTQRILEAAARAYACSPADLLTVDPSTPHGRTIAEALRLVPPERQPEAARYLEFLAEQGDGGYRADEGPAPPKRAARRKRI
ncbi:MAG: helix-turn-helix domain-containing protein [Alphaproteobacteria bacterium]|nr:helix-turn-helix domain-containing protein [Alphaproteobacteria bacterium]